MNVDELQKLVEMQESHETLILFAKNKLRRGLDDDVFTNFRKTAVMSDSSTIDVIITEMSKHIISLVTYVKTSTQINVPFVLEHVSDARNYLMLLLAFVDEQDTFNTLLQNLTKEQEQVPKTPDTSVPLPRKKRGRPLASHSAKRKSLS